jgi:DNA-binding transcriptional LysR family regulator
LTSYTKNKKNFAMRNLKLDQLHSFTKVVELGTFSAAAEQLGLTQPAVSLHIRELERRVGITLIERVGKKARPTAAGIEMLGYARTIDEIATHALDRMAVHKTGTLGRVRIGTGATACINLLPALLRNLRTRFPTLEFTVTTGNTSDILPSLEDNSLDVGLVTLPATGRALTVTPIIQDPFIAIAAKETKLLPAVATPAALADLPLILYEAGGHTRQILDAWFTKAGVRPAPIMDLGNVEAIKELVGAGLGCAILPGTSLRREKDRARFETLPLTPNLSRELAIVLRKDKPLHKGLRHTIAALKTLSEI